MIQIETQIRWDRNGATFTDNRYSRAHDWTFDGGTNVRASSSPHIVPLPYSDPTAVDPEEAFIAAISSCHMLWFLSFAAKEKWMINSYHDAAVGTMEKNEAGKLVISKVELRPQIVWESKSVPSPSDIARLHEQAHAECFIANSIKTEVTVANPGFE